VFPVYRSPRFRLQKLRLTTLTAEALRPPKPQRQAQTKTIAARAEQALDDSVCLDYRKGLVDPGRLWWLEHCDRPASSPTIAKLERDAGVTGIFRKSYRQGDRQSLRSALDFQNRQNLSKAEFIRILLLEKQKGS
jgi:hypothetical protein